MCEHEQKYCPRCKNAFECKVGSILLCQCSTVALSQEQRDYVAARYPDCLCAACLTDMKAEHHQSLFREKLNSISSLHFPKPE